MRRSKCGLKRLIVHFDDADTIVLRRSVGAVPDHDADGKALQSKDGIFQREEVQWNEDADEYCCLAGNPLRREWCSFRNRRTHLIKNATAIYRGSQRDCAA